MVEVLKKYFEDLENLTRTVWKHEECAHPIVTYSKPSGEGIMFFLDEEGKGNPSTVKVKELPNIGWEKEEERLFSSLTFEAGS